MTASTLQAFMSFWSNRWLAVFPRAGHNY